MAWVFVSYSVAFVDPDNFVIPLAKLLKICPIWMELTCEKQFCCLATDPGFNWTASVLESPMLIQQSAYVCWTRFYCRLGFFHADENDPQHIILPPSCFTMSMVFSLEMLVNPALGVMFSYYASYIGTQWLK